MFLVQLPPTGSQLNKFIEKTLLDLLRLSRFLVDSQYIIY